MLGLSCSSDGHDDCNTEKINAERKLYEILQIYIAPERRGQRNSSQLSVGYDTPIMRTQVKRMVCDHLYKDIKLWDDSVMWNINPN